MERRIQEKQDENTEELWHGEAKSERQVHRRYKRYCPGNSHYTRIQHEQIHQYTNYHIFIKNGNLTEEGSQTCTTKTKDQEMHAATAVVESICKGLTQNKDSIAVLIDRIGKSKLFALIAQSREL